MAFLTHAHVLHAPASAPHPHQRFTVKRVCIGLLLLCIAGAALALPLVRNLLNFFQAQPHWTPMEHWLAQMPMFSWLMMAVWGTLVPISLLVMLHYHRNILGVVVALGFAAVAIAWYVHMPSQAQCAALYDDSGWCTVIEWAYSLSLGIANAVYLFALVMLLLGGLSVAALPAEEDDDENTF